MHTEKLILLRFTFSLYFSLASIFLLLLLLILFFLLFVISVIYMYLLFAYSSLSSSSSLSASPLRKGFWKLLKLYSTVPQHSD